MTQLIVLYNSYSILQYETKMTESIQEWTKLNFVEDSL